MAEAPETPVEETPPEKEEFRHPLDIAFEKENAELQKLIDQQAVSDHDAIPAEPPPQQAETPEPTAPAKEEPPAAPVQEPPVEEPVRQAEPPKDQNAWKLLREKQREMKVLEARLAALEEAAKRPAPVAEPEYDPGYAPEAEQVPEATRIIAQEVLKLQDQIQRTEQQNQFKAVIDEVTREENDFSREHPDYNKAMEYLVQTRRSEYEALGVLDNDAAMLMRNNPDHVEEWAIKLNKQPEDAAREMAFMQRISQERMQFIGAARQAGRKIPEAVYNIAVQRGYKSANGNGTAAPTPTQTQEKQSREAVARAKEIANAGQSLSSMQNVQTTKDRAITKRSQLMSMSPEEQGRYIFEMDNKFGPAWVEDLE